MSKYVKFFHIEESLKTSSRKFDRDLVHSFSMLQSTFYIFNTLNKLLGNIIPMPKVSHFINGTFVYNMVVYIGKKSRQFVTRVNEHIQNMTKFKRESFIVDPWG